MKYSPLNQRQFLYAGEPPQRTGSRFQWELPVSQTNATLGTLAGSTLKSMIVLLSLRRFYVSVATSTDSRSIATTQADALLPKAYIVPRPSPMECVLDVPAGIQIPKLRSDLNSFPHVLAGWKTNPIYHGTFTRNACSVLYPTAQSKIRAGDLRQ